MTNSVQPPADNSLHSSTANIEAAEETVPICEDEVKLGNKSACDALHSSTANIEAAEETVPICEDEAKLGNNSAYNALHSSTANIEAAEETVPICEDDAKLGHHPFDDKTTRLLFIQKMLTVKLLQLLGTLTIMVIFAIKQSEIHYFMSRNNNYVHVFILLPLAYVITLGLLVYCDQARRTNPYRYMFLVAHPLSFALLISFCSTWWYFEIAVVWLYYCTAVFALLVYSIFAYQTKLEFATGYCVIVSTLTLIIMYALSVPFMPYSNPLHILYPTVVVCLRIIFLVLNVEMITSKDYRIIFTSADFVDGTIDLYIDYFYLISYIRDGFWKHSAPSASGID